MRKPFVHLLSLAIAAAAGCGGSSSTPSSDGNAPSSSEVAASVVSGAMNASGGAAFGLIVPRPRRSTLDRLLDALSPIGKAYAATWSCTGGALDRAFAGDGQYQYTPRSCSVQWANGKTASSAWSGPFTVSYSGSCDATHAWIGNQAGGCTATRTTAAGGDTRTITGPNGNAYAITHDTNGAGTGWDAQVSPAPGNGGVAVTCGVGGCPSAGGTVSIAGSHLTGTVTPVGGSPDRVWDHTVSTAGAPLTFTASGTTRLLSGAVTVQHNLARYTATSTFSGVGYGQAGCCFPTSGTVTTTFVNGPNQGKTETLTFTPVCGEATLSGADGNTTPVTLQHCL